MWLNKRNGFHYDHWYNMEALAKAEYEAERHHAHEDKPTKAELKAENTALKARIQALEAEVDGLFSGAQIGEHGAQ